MLRNKLVRSDGSIIDSSVIISCEFTEEVNSGTNLTVGNTTAAELTVEMLSTYPIQQDEVLTYFVIEDGVEKQIGVFKAEKPTVASRTSMRFSAYDNIVKTEKLFSDWLRENQALFPMTLLQLVRYACDHAGVTLATVVFPNGDLSIEAFYADDITCRQILSWAGAIAGRFVRANSMGEIEFNWYTDTTDITITPDKRSVSNPVTITDDGDGNVSIMSDSLRVTDDGNGNVAITSNDLMLVDDGEGNLTLVTGSATTPYLQGSLSYENYATDLIERVQINHSEDDVGVLYPEETAGNCFTVSGNMLLGTLESARVMTVAESLYTQLRNISYVPFTVTVPRTLTVRAGYKVTIITADGKSFDSYVMKCTVSPTGTSIEATGDKSYGSNAAVASEKYDNLTGKILSVSKSVDGLKIKNEDLEGRMGSLELTTDQFKTEIRDTYVSEDEFGEYKTTVSTQFEQTGTGFEMKFGEVKQSIDAVNKDLQDKYSERNSYIRFEDGNIILGKSDSEITLVQRNNRISFLQNGSEVAYIANDKMYITDGEFVRELRIGKFAYVPGANGNLSFRKVVD